ncbi:MAG: NUDIX hydrolase [Candidatus Izemoplasmatales bacterium]
MKYIKDIENYKPYNEHEIMDKQLILNFIQNNSDHLYRENLAGHITSSAIVINQDKTKVLFAYHNIYDSWGWVGGHNDGDDDLLKVAIKETKEETGIKEVKPYLEDIYMLDVIYVENHIKNGKLVPDHLHLNVTYLLIADDTQILKVKEDENQAVAWIELEDVFNKISEPRMVPIYKKAFDKLKAI